MKQLHHCICEWKKKITKLYLGSSLHLSLLFSIKYNTWKNPPSAIILLWLNFYMNEINLTIANASVDHRSFGDVHLDVSIWYRWKIHTTKFNESKLKEINTFLTKQHTKKQYAMEKKRNDDWKKIHTIRCKFRQIYTNIHSIVWITIEYIRTETRYTIFVISL